MKPRLGRSLALCTLLFVSGSLPTTSPGADGPYKFQKRIPVGGQGGGWDYMSVDTVNRRLFVSHANSVAVLDIGKDLLVGTITNTPGVHGVVAVPDLHRGFISVGRQNKVAVFDLETLNIEQTIDAGPNPDAMVYDSPRQQLFVFNGRGHSATVLDAKDGKVLATVELGGQPEFAALDDKEGQVYDNIVDKHEVVAIDAKTHQVLERWPVKPGQFPGSMAIDEENKRLFVGCHNNKMLMLDSLHGNVLAEVPIGSRVDASAYDPQTHLAFAACGDGTLTVAREEGTDKLIPVQTIQTEKGSRTMALDPTTHRIFVAAAKYLPPPDPVPGVRPEGPKMVPDSFGVLVYELQQ